MACEVEKRVQGAILRFAQGVEEGRVPQGGAPWATLQWKELRAGRPSHLLGTERETLRWVWELRLGRVRQAEVNQERLPWRWDILG